MHARPRSPAYASFLVSQTELLDLLSPPPLPLKPVDERRNADALLCPLPCVPLATFARKVVSEALACHVVISEEKPYITDEIGVHVALSIPVENFLNFAAAAFI